MKANADLKYAFPLALAWFVLLADSLTKGVPQVYPWCVAELPAVDAHAHDKFSGATLQLVQVVTRHGDRAPLRALWFNEQSFFHCGDTVHRMNGHFRAEDAVQGRRIYMDGDTSQAHAPFWKGNCFPGQLTGKGFRQHVNLGARFRQLYVTNNGFLSATFNTSEIYLYSTNIESVPFLLLFCRRLNFFHSKEDFSIGDRLRIRPLSSVDASARTVHVPHSRLPRQSRHLPSLSIPMP